MDLIVGRLLSTSSLRRVSPLESGFQPELSVPESLDELRRFLAAADKGSSLPGLKPLEDRSLSRDGTSEGGDALGDAFRVDSGA